MKWRKRSGRKSMAFSTDQALGYLRDANTHGRLAHAFLFSGPDGSGKRQLVADFFSLVNAEKTDQADLHVIEPESKSRKILVEQIRELESSLRMRATRARTKFGVVYEADRLMTQAANAFLKTLEEPPDHSFLILVSALPEALLETIRSRCIEVQLRAAGPKTPTVEEAELLAELCRIAGAEGFSVVTALKLAGVFRGVSGKVRAKIEAEHDALLTSDRTAYKQTTDGAWLEEREDRLSALTESRYVKARENLVLRMIEWFGDALRVKHESPFLDLIDYRAAVTALAGKTSVFELLKRLGALESLLNTLARNVHEALAVEAAFLVAFGPATMKANGDLARDRIAR
jgi:DNA polymerase-3 subunit delta'